jgi:catechol 2,3-dioxygenase-like lactoylglutathione lyase family enzyme
MKSADFADYTNFFFFICEICVICRLFSEENNLESEIEMTNNIRQEDAVTTAPPWRGFHHIALVTPDLEATISFYQNVLGMHVGEIYPATDRNGRHCFIKPGTSETWGLHFFEQAGAQIFSYPETLARFTFIPGSLQHIAFALPDEAAGLALRERLQRYNILITEIGELGPIHNTLFLDNNGVLLEATWPKP